jgi:hypothetical protein
MSADCLSVRTDNPLPRKRQIIENANGDKTMPKENSANTRPSSVNFEINSMEKPMQPTLAVKEPAQESASAQKPKPQDAPKK